MKKRAAAPCLAREGDSDERNQTVLPCCGTLVCEFFSLCGGSGATGIVFPRLMLAWRRPHILCTTAPCRSNTSAWLCFWHQYPSPSQESSIPRPNVVCADEFQRLGRCGHQIFQKTARPLTAKKPAHHQYAAIACHFVLITGGRRFFWESAPPCICLATPRQAAAPMYAVTYQVFICFSCVGKLFIYRNFLL